MRKYKSMYNPWAVSVVLDHPKGMAGHVKVAGWSLLDGWRAMVTRTQFAGSATPQTVGQGLLKKKTQISATYFFDGFPLMLDF